MQNQRLKIAVLFLFLPGLASAAVPESKGVTEKCFRLFGSLGAPKAALAHALEFKIPQSQIDRAQKVLDKKLLSETYFVVPYNDGEAKRAVEVLKAAKAPHLHVSSQGWGAVLEKEALPSIEELKKRGVKRVAVFEMPGAEVEQKLRDAGIEVSIIDHHSYKGLDRRHPESSLEQLMSLIKWPPSRTDMALAVNDRGYIPGLKSMHLTEDEISAVRHYDLLAQGRDEHNVNAQVQEARALIPKLPKRDGIFILDDSTLDEGILKQELAIQSADGLVSSFTGRGGKIGFSGDPAMAQALLDFPFEELGYAKGSFAQYGGGDPSASMFFGFKPNNPPIGETEILPKKVIDAIWAVMKSAKKGNAMNGPKTVSSAIGTKLDPQVKTEMMMPRGSALATSAGDLEKQGIRQIIHGASGSMTLTGSAFDPTLDGVTNSVTNALELARANGHKRLAIPFIGGKVFIDRIGINAQELANEIVDRAMRDRKDLELRFVTFGEEDTALFQRAVARHAGKFPQGAVEVNSGSLTDFKLHGASAIMNAANMEVTFGGGLSGVIGRATNNSQAIDEEARAAIRAFYEKAQ